jgi:hypothetical protein
MRLTVRGILSMPFSETMLEGNRSMMESLAHRRWSNLLSFRVIFGALILAFAAAFVASLIAGVLIAPVFWIAFVAVMFIATDPGHVLRCPHCGKRVKAGHDTCHHCTRSVVPTA